MFVCLQWGSGCSYSRASLAPSRFYPTTVAYSLGKFLTNAAQHRSYPKSARYGRAWDRTHDPVVWPFGLASTAFGRTTPHRCLNRPAHPTALVSKVGAVAQSVCKRLYKPQQPQQSTNSSLPVAWDYSACQTRRASSWTQKKRL